MDCGSVINFCVVYLINAHNHLISSNRIRKLACKVKFISQINVGLIMFFGNLRIKFFQHKSVFKVLK